MKQETWFLLIVLLAWLGVSCQKEGVVPEPETRESYVLSVTPGELEFPAAGKEITVEITATKNRATVLDGDTIEYIVNNVAYSVSLSGKGFDIEGNTVSAEPNPGDRREGTLEVTIDGTDIQKTILLTQKSGEDEEDEEDGGKDDNGGLPSLPGVPY